MARDAPRSSGGALGEQASASARVGAKSFGLWVV